MMQWKNICLIGFMGTGKTTVGMELAKLLNWQMVNLDDCIEESEQDSISNIFAIQGEAYFRQKESETLALILLDSSRIISTGGGAVLAESNRAVMQQNSLVVALKATAETIIKRVSGDQNRPLLNGDAAARVHELLERRRDAYDFADVTIETDHRSVEKIAASILEAAESYIRKESMDS